MTHTSKNSSGIVNPGFEPETGGSIDTEQLAADLFEAFAGAQRDLMRARAARDQRGADERLLCMRASALLLACLPVDPDARAFRLKTLVAVALRDEDGDEGSHAWQMLERALQLDQRAHPPSAIGG